MWLKASKAGRDPIVNACLQKACILTCGMAILHFGIALSLRRTPNDLQSSTSQLNLYLETDMTQETVRTTHLNEKIRKETEMLNRLSQLNVVPNRTHNSSHGESPLYIFEGNEAVIKMTIKGKSTTIRHVSRTHRVAVDWLFDMINLDPRIQIKYVDTKNQLADILTKGICTRDEWNHLIIC